MAFITDEVFADYRRVCKERWGITVVEKNTSKLMKLLSVVLFFNKRFMTDYVTTIGKTVYWPNADKLTGNDFSRFFHEVQHGADYRESPFWFIFYYLSPQSAALLVLMALLTLTGNLFWLLSLLFLLSLAPLPSVTRTSLELRGYSCNMAYALWTQGFVPSHMLQSIRGKFTSSAYYYMWPFPRSMDRKLKDIENAIVAGELTQVQDETAQFLVHHGIIEEAP